MSVYVRSSGAWRQSPTDNTRTIWIRTGGQWKQALDIWVRWNGAWHKEPSYSASLAAPTNLRVTSAAGDHSGISVAWDWSGVLIPDDFEIVLTNEGGDVWIQDKSVAGDQRSYRFTGMATNTRYKVWVRARHSGRTETAWAGPVNWYVGYDSYIVYDQVIYGWSGNEEWFSPYWYVNWYSSGLDTVLNSVDGRDDTRWITANATEPWGSTQGEGIRLGVPLPTDKKLLTGVHIYSNGYTYCWFGFNWFGGWQGSAYPYNGKYGPLQHNYMGAGGGDPSAGQGGYYYYVRDGEQFGGNWDLSTPGANPYVDCLFQHNTPAQPTIEIWEIKLLLHSWVDTGQRGPRTIPAANSGAY